MTDLTQQIIEQVKDAQAANETIRIRGEGTKDFMGRAVEADRVLEVGGHSGIVNYQPVELVLTARAGTPLIELESALADEGQMLAFEPPRFGGKATLGGTLATNLSGPGRPWWGSVRDHVLGVNLINGEGERLRFGGQVMKNVAGYDMSRLQAGAFGALGVMTEISLKVLPKPATTRTLKFAMDQAEAIAQMNKFSGQPKPITAAFWADGLLHVRLAGAASAVDATAKSWGGEELDAADALKLWHKLQDRQLALFESDTLWRFSVRSNAEAFKLDGDSLINWGGAERWYSGDRDFAEMVKLAEAAGGQVSLYKGGDRQAEVMHPMAKPIEALQQRIKHSIDPNGLLNPGRAYSWL